jgi:hypothetical protein
MNFLDNKDWRWRCIGEIDYSSFGNKFTGLKSESIPDNLDNNFLENKCYL